MKKYTGATNYRERIYSTFTPCGSFIFSGSEDGMAYVWNTDTGQTNVLPLQRQVIGQFLCYVPAVCFFSPGDQVAVYNELCYPTALHCVSFHPHENMVAFCGYGQRQPVQVYLYDHKGRCSLTAVVIILYD